MYHGKIKFLKFSLKNICILISIYFCSTVLISTLRNFLHFPLVGEGKELEKCFLSSCLLLSAGDNLTKFLEYFYIFRWLERGTIVKKI
jgi:hypothetical protein